ncbi:MAG: NAD-dependent epimerase/dehydratase family protein [Acidobacteria bacterium]|nr:NAD-dependent epimerase/dehydratase family protein [Acidobacteriota bacterium]
MPESNNHLPRILVTGASGFVGKYFIESACEFYRIVGLARRSQVEAGVSYHPNIHWIQCDISRKARVEEAARYLRDSGGIDYVLHLAAFYDFDYSEKPEYTSTNIDGTRHILELARFLQVKRMIFSSSVAIFNFRGSEEQVDEKRVPDADFAYARTKKAGEQLMREYAVHIPCTIVRLAAVFSDWCEYGLLYRFLSNWVSGGLMSRILGGRGESAIPYIHIYDLIRCLMTILDRSDVLPRFDCYIASSERSISHQELFRLTTLYYFGKERRPIFMPKLLAYPGLCLRLALQRLHLSCQEAFERLWMLQYIDMKLVVDASYTYQTLDWQPKSRYHLLRRLLFLLEKMKSHPHEWRMRNEAKLHRAGQRANLLIYENLVEMKDEILAEIGREIIQDQENPNFRRYMDMDTRDLECYLNALYHLLLAAVRSGDRNLMLEYLDDVAMRRFADGFTPVEIGEVLSLFRRRLMTALYERQELVNFHQEIYDCIGLTIKMARDEIEELYDDLIQRMPQARIAASVTIPDCTRLQKLIRQFSAFYQVFPQESQKDNHSGKSLL